MPSRPRPLVLAIALALSTPAVPAATITVDDPAGGPGTATTCTLADAVTAANTNSGVNDCVAGEADPSADLILFDSSVSGTITLGAQLAINSNLTIDGASAVTVSGANSSPVFYIAPDSTVTLQGLTIQDGFGAYISYYGPPNPGGILNAGTLTVQDSSLSGNSSSADGGGITNLGTGSLVVQNSTLSGNFGTDAGGIVNFGSMTVQDSALSGNSGSSAGGIRNRGSLTVQDSALSSNYSSSGGAGIYNRAGSLVVQGSTLSGNSSPGRGGGIFNFATLTIQGSTLSGNSAGNGGGVYNIGALTVRDSTLSGNSAVSRGGGIFDYVGPMTLNNATLWGNSAGNGGGLYLRPYEPDLPAQVYNTVIGNSPGGGDCAGQLDVNTNNWIQDNTCAPAYSGDPLLGPLSDNGGPTLTHLPLTGSGLVDAGDPGTCTATDQRGVSRTEDGDGDGSAVCDIGAVEVIGALIFGDGFE